MFSICLFIVDKGLMEYNEDAWKKERTWEWQRMREKILLDAGWRFHLGDIEETEILDKGPVYMQAKTREKRTGPAGKGFKDIPNDFSDSDEITALSWREVRIPHDYMIEQPPLKEHNFTLGA